MLSRPAQLRVKAGAHLEQAADAALDAGLARRRLGRSREDREQRGLAGAVRPDDAQDLAAPHV